MFFGYGSNSSLLGRYKRQKIDWKVRKNDREMACFILLSKHIATRIDYNGFVVLVEKHARPI